MSVKGSSKKETSKKRAPLRAREVVSKKATKKQSKSSVKKADFSCFCGFLAKSKQGLTKHRNARHVKPEEARKKRDKLKEKKVEYDEALAFEILDVIELKGCTLKEALASDPRFPTRRTFYRWREKNPELEEEYRLVCEARDDDDFDDMESIAKKTDAKNFVQNNMILNNRKWMLARRQPTKYGTKKIDMKQQHSGEVVLEMVNYADTDTPSATEN